MPPRLRFQPKRLRLCTSNASYPSCTCRHASLATATPATPPPPSLFDHTIHASVPISHHAPTQPPSYKPAGFRKSQLHRQYASLLRSSPLMLLFQHNNLKATEWSGIRRELTAALRKVDAELSVDGQLSTISEAAKVQIVQTGIFASALKVVEFFHPDQSDEARTHHPSDPRVASSASIENTKTADPVFVHGLSRTAWETARTNTRLQHGLEPLLSGPLMLVTLPAVSPQHLKATLSTLAPSEKFPAPKRKANPAYHEPAVQSGLQKLILLGARVEGKVFDTDGTRWVGGIAGGLGGLQGQLVAMLQSIGAGLTNTLEGAGKSLYVTMESRRSVLEDEQKGEGEKKGEGETKE